MSLLSRVRNRVRTGQWTKNTYHSKLDKTHCLVGLFEVELAQQNSWCVGQAAEETATDRSYGYSHTFEPWEFFDRNALDENEEVLAVCEVIEEQFPDRVRSYSHGHPDELIPRFNDDPNTTAEDVELVCWKAELGLAEQVPDWGTPDIVVE